MGLKVNIGCGIKKIPGFLNIDQDPNCNPDVIDTILLWTQQDNSIDLIYACHVLEHSSRIKSDMVLGEWYKKLTNNGQIYISVPDIEAICLRYLIKKDLEELKGFIWGGQKTYLDYHCNGWDEKTLKISLQKAGFTQIERYDWRTTEWSYIDDYSQAYLPHMDKINGQHMSLNIRATKQCMT